MGEKQNSDGSVRNGTLVQNILKAVAVILVVVSLLSFTQYFVGWLKSSKDVGNQLSRTPFFIGHIFDPDVDGYGFLTWNQEEWIIWLNKRDRLLKPHNRKPLRMKGINSVFIANPHQLQNAFPNLRKRDGRYWSDVRFASYVFVKTNKGYQNVYKCPPMYVLVEIRNGEPVHLHAHSTCKFEGDHHPNNHCKVNVKRDCVLV